MSFFNRVPLAIVNKAHQANQTYPFAISLIESVRAYERTLEKVRPFHQSVTKLKKNTKHTRQVNLINFRNTLCFVFKCKLNRIKIQNYTNYSTGFTIYPLTTTQHVPLNHQTHTVHQHVCVCVCPDDT